MGVPHYRHLWGGIHRWPVDSPHKGPVMWKAFPCDDSLWLFHLSLLLTCRQGQFHRSLVDSPHKGPVMWKASPCDGSFWWFHLSFLLICGQGQFHRSLAIAGNHWNEVNAFGVLLLSEFPQGTSASGFCCSRPENIPRHETGPCRMPHRWLFNP